jgi:hypothetical protein
MGGAERERTGGHVCPARPVRRRRGRKGEGRLQAERAGCEGGGALPGTARRMGRPCHATPARVCTHAQVCCELEPPLPEVDKGWRLARTRHGTGHGEWQKGPVPFRPTLKLLSSAFCASHQSRLLPPPPPLLCLTCVRLPSACVSHGLGRGVGRHAQEASTGAPVGVGPGVGPLGSRFRRARRVMWDFNPQS